jgi:thioredoxin-dependent peroxiredoxin
MIEAGDRAPSFEAEDQDGNVHTLQDYTGRWLVLYFYPKDATSGCTTQACGFRDSLASLQAQGAAVLGASADDADSHRAFAQAHDLGFPLLVDPDRELLEAYEAWGEKQRFGRRYAGVFRKTYLIAPDGTIARVWPKVTVEGHAEEVRRAIEELAPRRDGDAAARR